ncbi:MAG: class I SAM-dependent methyltransferase [Actinomycetota bacterium]
MATDEIAWYHTIDLGSGRLTPGFYDCRPIVERVPWPASLRGRRCLDVGTFDGFWAFEMERRGASEVIALDLEDPTRMDWPSDVRETGPALIREVRSSRGPGFETARAALGSSVRRIDRSVYELDGAELGSFDVVFVGALLLHLRDPALALERLHTVTSGDLIVVEPIDPALQTLAPRVPAARFRGMGLEMQWWVLNAAGLARILRSAGFEVLRRTRPFVTPFGTSPWVPGKGSRRRRMENLLVTGSAADGAPTVGFRVRPSS